MLSTEFFDSLQRTDDKHPRQHTLTVHIVQLLFTRAQTSMMMQGLCNMENILAFPSWKR